MTQTNAPSIPARFASPRLQLPQLFLFVPSPAPVLTGDVYEQIPTIMTVKLAPFACECFINFVCTLALEHEKAFITKRLRPQEFNYSALSFPRSAVERDCYIKLQSSLSSELSLFWVWCCFYYDCWLKEHLIYLSIRERWPRYKLSKVIRTTLICSFLKDIHFCSIFVRGDDKGQTGKHIWLEPTTSTITSAQLSAFKCLWIICANGGTACCKAGNYNLCQAWAVEFLARATDDACGCLLSALVASWETSLKVTDAALARPAADLSLTLESNLVFCSLLQPRKEIWTKHVRLDPSSDALGRARTRHSCV